MIILNRIGKLFSSEPADKGDTALEKAAACKQRGNEHLAQGRHDEAIACYQEAVAIAPDYAEAINNLGHVCLRLDRDDDAEKYLNQAISLNPDLANAYYNLGNLFRKRGRTDEALANYEQARTLNPDNAEAHYSLGELFLALGRDPEALDSLRCAVELDSSHVMAHQALGLVCQRLGRLEEAREGCRRAALLRPDSFLAHYNLAMILRQMGVDNEAMASLNRTIALSPNFVDAYFELGNLLREQSQFDAAILYYEKAIGLKSEHPHAHNNLGLVFLRQGKLDEAAACFREAIHVGPDVAAAYQNLADVLHKQGRFDDARANADRAIALDPGFAEPYITKGLALKGQGELREAQACFRQALTMNSEREATRFAMATVFLSCGELAEGWELFGHRFFDDSPTCKRDFSYPLWDGEDLRDKAILLWGDQGIGDEMLFASLFPEIIARARRCVVECAPKLVPLFSRSFPGAHVLPRTHPPHPATLEGIDVQIAAADAARWLRPSLESFPRHDGYLTPDAARVAHWKARLAELGPGLKVGICWRSSVATSYRNLHYTSLDQWGPIVAVPGVHFVNLQYDDCDEELEAARQRFGIPLHAFEEVDLFDDLDEAAALTKAMDLVITAATAASGLAAAQGVPTWELGYGTTWVALGTDHVPWLPSQRLFMRRWNQPWEEIIVDIAQQLRALLDTQATG